MGVLLMVWCMVGCAVEDVAPLPQDSTVVAFPVDRSPSYEQVLVEPGADRQAGEALDAPSDDPCACDTVDCMAAWVDGHLGCDVCAGFVCDDAPAEHVCNPCDAVDGDPALWSGGANPVR